MKQSVRKAMRLIFLTFASPTLYLLFQDLHFLFEALKLRLPPYSTPSPVTMQSNIMQLQ